MPGWVVTMVSEEKLNIIFQAAIPALQAHICQSIYEQAQGKTWLIQLKKLQQNDKVLLNALGRI